MAKKVTKTPKKAPRLRRPPAPRAMPQTQDVDRIASLGELIPDPINARVHTPRSVGTIADAIQDVGLGRSIVINDQDVILAGNGTADAAAQVGLTGVRIVRQNRGQLIAVRRSGLTPEQKTRLAIADNRAGELSSWDQSVLTELGKIDGIDLPALWGGAMELPAQIDEPAAADADPMTADAPQPGAALTLLRGRLQLTDDQDARLAALLDRFAIVNGSLSALGDAMVDAMQEIVNARR